MAEVLGATFCRHYSPDRVRAFALSQLRTLGEAAAYLIGLGRIQQAKLQTPPLTSHGAPGCTSCQPAEHHVTPVPTPVQQCIHTSLTALAAIRWIVSQFEPDMYTQLLAEPIHATLEVLNIMLVPFLSDLTIDMTKVLQLGMPVLIQAAMHSPLIQHRQLEAVLMPLMCASPVTLNSRMHTWPFVAHTSWMPGTPRRLDWRQCRKVRLHSDIQAKCISCSCMICTAQKHGGKMILNRESDAPLCTAQVLGHGCCIHSRVRSLSHGNAVKCRCML